MSADQIVCFFLITLKLSTASAPLHLHELIVWNVGQGQWVSEIDSDRCRHFDVGGEWGSFYRIKNKVLRLCAGKQNEIYLSHWDEDHIMNIPNLARGLSHLCWAAKPAFFSEKRNARKILNLQIPDCTQSSADVTMWTPKFAETSNDSANVFLSSKFLMPGDSTIAMENRWSREIARLSSTEILILGHHGSRTSTGETLMAQLPRLRAAVVSARYKKYGHPHRETLARLRRFNIPVIKTEDWGNIYFLF